MRRRYSLWWWPAETERGPGDLDTSIPTTAAAKWDSRQAEVFNSAKCNYPIPVNDTKKLNLVPPIIWILCANQVLQSLSSVPIQAPLTCYLLRKTTLNLHLPFPIHTYTNFRHTVRFSGEEYTSSSSLHPQHLTQGLAHRRRSSVNICWNKRWVSAQFQSMILDTVG